jgi:predicted Zn-dependent protease
MTGNERCLSKADDVASWLQALIDKPNGKSVHRYYSLVHLFAIRMKQGRFANALSVADLGLSLNKRNPRFGLMQAHALIGLKRLNESETLLNDIQQSPAGRVRKYAERIKQLKGAIQIIRQKTPTTK